MKLSRRIAVSLIVAGALAVVEVQAGTSDVFRVQTTLAGTVQIGVFSNGVISKVLISAGDLVNLAQRRELSTPVPKNEVLALTSDCSSNDVQPSRLIIFDTIGKSNLVTIGSLSNLAASAYTRRHYIETMTKITVNDISDGTNGITGGSFYYHGKITVPTNGCPTGFGGQLTGFLGTAFPLTITNFPCTNFFTFITQTNCAPVSNTVFNVTSADRRRPCDGTNVLVDVIRTNCVPDGTTNIINTVQTYNVIVPRTAIITGPPIGQLAP